MSENKDRKPSTDPTEVVGTSNEPNAETEHRDVARGRGSANEANLSSAGGSTPNHDTQTTRAEGSRGS